MMSSIRLIKRRGCARAKLKSCIPAIACCWLLDAPPAIATTDLLTVFRMAEQTDPTYADVQTSYMSAIEDKKQAEAKLWLPTAGVTASVGRNRQQGSFQIDTALGGLQNQELSQADLGNLSAPRYFTNTLFNLEISQPIYHWDRVIALAQTETRRKAAETSVSAAHQKLMIRVAERYFDVLAATDNLAFANAEAKALGDQLHQVARRHALGTVAVTDLQEAQASYDLAAAKTIEQQNQLSISRAQLREVLNEDVTPLAPLSRTIQPRLPEPSLLQPWVDIALRQNLDIASANYSSQESSDEIRRQSAEHLPSLDLRATQSYSDTGGRLGSNSVDTGLSLNLSIPIYEGGQVSSRTRQAEYRHRGSLYRLEQQVRAVRQQTEASLLGVLSSVERVKALTQAEVSNTTAAKATHRSYEIGARTALDVVLSERNLARAHTDLSRAKYDYVLNTLKLKQAAGTLSPADLVLVNSWLDSNNAVSKLSLANESDKRLTSKTSGRENDHKKMP